MNQCVHIVVYRVHSKITFSIARNVIMIGLLSKRGDVGMTTPRLVYIGVSYIFVRKVKIVKYISVFLY